MSENEDSFPRRLADYLGERATPWRDVDLMREAVVEAFSVIAGDVGARDDLLAWLGIGRCQWCGTEQCLCVRVPDTRTESESDVSSVSEIEAALKAALAQSLYISSQGWPERPTLADIEQGVERALREPEPTEVIAELQRHRNANLVRAVFDGWDEDRDGALIDYINAEGFDRVPWRVSETMRARAEVAEAKVTELEAERDRYKYWRSTAVADAERSLAELAAERVKVEQLTAALREAQHYIGSCGAYSVPGVDGVELLRRIDGAISDAISRGTVGQVTEPQSDCSCGCCRGRACTCDAHSMDEQCRCPYCDYVRREMWHADECSKNHSILRCPYVSESE